MAARVVEPHAKNTQQCSGNNFYCAASYRPVKFGRLCERAGAKVSSTFQRKATGYR